MTAPGLENMIIIEEPRAASINKSEYLHEIRGFYGVTKRQYSRNGRIRMLKKQKHYQQCKKWTHNTLKNPQTTRVNSYLVYVSPY